MFKGWNIEWHSAAAQCVELQMHAGHANSVFTNSAWIHDNIFCSNSPQGKGRKNTGNNSSRVKYTIRDTNGPPYLTGKLRNRVLQCTCSHGVRVRVRVGVRSIIHTYEEDCSCALDLRVS